MPRETDTTRGETRKEAAEDRTEAPQSDHRSDDRQPETDHRFRDWALI